MSFWRATERPQRLDIGLDRVLINLDRHGITVDASIPTALSERNEQEQLKYGDRLVLSGVGSPGSPPGGHRAVRAVYVTKVR
jgi:3-oxoacyl-[acyl-carrier-protein] synthase III